MKGRRLIGLFCAAALLLAALCLPCAAADFNAIPVQASEPAPEVDAVGVCLYNTDTGVCIYQSGAQEQVPVAFAAKVMTALVVADSMELSDEVTVHEHFANGISALSSLAFQEGERTTVKELLYCLFVKSADEAANILALANASSLGGFVSKMNDKAAELGMENTHFTSPFGMDDGQSYTTAADAVLLLAALRENDTLLKISDTTYHNMAATNLTGKRDMYSSNLLLNPESSSYYPGACGGKNDYTNGFGYSVGTTAKINGLMMTVAVMGADMSAASTYAQTAALLEWAGTQYMLAKAVSAGTVYGTADLLLCKKTDTMLLTSRDDMVLILPADSDLSLIRVEPEVESPLFAPFAEGDELGEAKVYYGDTQIGTVGIVAGQEARRDTGMTISYGLSKFFSSPIVIAILLMLLISAICYIGIAISLRKKKKK